MMKIAIVLTVVAALSVAGLLADTAIGQDCVDYNRYWHWSQLVELTQPRDIAVDANYAYVTTDSGFHIFDITDPTRPTETAAYGGISPWSIDISAGNAFMIVGNELQVIDVRQPGAPQWVSSLTLPGAFHRVVVDRYAFVSAFGAGLHIIDIALPSAPALVRTIGAPNALQLVAGGGYVYLGHESGVQIIDVTNPPSARVVGNIPTPGAAFGLAIHENLLFIGDSTLGLTIVDISLAEHPVLLSTVALPEGASYVAIAGQVAFVRGDLNHTFAIDFSVAISPIISGTLHRAGSMAFSQGETFLYMADPDFGLRVASVENTHDPDLIGSTALPGFQRGLELANNRAYLANETNGVQILNIVDPALPTVVATYNTPGFANDVAVAGSFLYVADGSMGLLVVNCTIPEQPTFVARVGQNCNYRCIEIVGNVAAVADGLYGIRIIDIAIPGVPLIVGGVALSDRPRALRMSGTILFVVNERDGMEIYDIIDPASPRLLSSVLQNERLVGIDVHGGVAYVCDEQFRLHVVDVSNPATPTAVGVVSMPGRGNSIRIQNEIAYVACDDAGLQLVDVRNPTRPIIIGGVYTSSIAYDVAPTGDCVFISGRDFGLQVASNECGGAVANSVSDFEIEYLWPTCTIRWSISGMAAYEFHLMASRLGNTRMVPLHDLQDGTYSAVDDARDLESGGWVNYSLYGRRQEGAWVLLHSESAELTPSARELISPTVHPNPFNPRTTIKYDLPESGPVRLSVFDIAGRLVRTLVDESKPQGSHEAVWDGRDTSGREVGSGSYLARLEFGGKVETVRMGLVR